jgi:hypothetical protein
MHHIRAAPPERIAHPEQPGVRHPPGRIDDPGAALGPRVPRGGIRLVNAHVLSQEAAPRHPRADLRSELGIREYVQPRPPGHALQDLLRHVGEVIHRGKELLGRGGAGAEDHLEGGARLPGRRDDEVGEPHYRDADRRYQQPLPGYDAQIAIGLDQVQPEHPACEVERLNRLRQFRAESVGQRELAAPAPRHAPSPEAPGPSALLRGHAPTGAGF